MTKKILAGQIRELVNAVGGAVAAFGFVNQEIASASGGVLLSVLMLIWGIKDKEGFGVLASLVRKLIASAAGAALVLGWLDKDKFEALEFISAAVLPVVLGFSATSERRQSHQRAPGAFVFCLSCPGPPILRGFDRV